MSNHIEQGSKHIWLPYTQMMNHLPQLEISHAKGSKIFLKDGSNLIDGVSSWWSTAHGYNHPHLIKELVKQAKILPHIMLAGFANDQTYKLSHRLCKFTAMNRVFFSDSGSTAVEVAMKIAWQFHANQAKTKKIKFISFKNSYHGDTTGAMSLADLNCGMHKKFKSALLENFSLDLPKNDSDLDKFEQFIKQNRETIAAVFIEPMVQCAGGMRFHSAEILKSIYKISKENSLIFIADECATGFFRSGKKFAVNHAEIKPDIMIVGKALTGGIMTLAATLVSEEIFSAFLGESLDLALMHGPTFMGNALACAAANASLDLFENNDYEKKVFNIEILLKKELAKCRNLSGVKDVRVLGSIGVVEIKDDWQKMKKLRKEFIDYGVFLRPFCGCLYIMPALTIKKLELKSLTKACLSALQTKLD